MQKDAAYGQIVCRCEMVSAGGDPGMRYGVERRRWMGLSYGPEVEWEDAKADFAHPKIIRLLSEELGLPPEQISKNGPG